MTLCKVGGLSTNSSTLKLKLVYLRKKMDLEIQRESLERNKDLTTVKFSREAEQAPSVGETRQRPQHPRAGFPGALLLLWGHQHPRASDTVKSFNNYVGKWSLSMNSRIIKKITMKRKQHSPERPGPGQVPPAFSPPLRRSEARGRGHRSVLVSQASPRPRTHPRRGAPDRDPSVTGQTTNPTK